MERSKMGAGRNISGKRLWARGNYRVFGWVSKVELKLNLRWEMTAVQQGTCFDVTVDIALLKQKEYSPVNGAVNV